MAEIHVLSSDTINRIAAGEVVERPVNVVKELVENAIDAGATAVTVEIKGGGIDLIRVTDNGSGIEPSQIAKAFRRHATSKIREADDLGNLHSLGFRGEALSSIAAVSRVEMITKTRDSIVGIRAVNDTAGQHPSNDPSRDADATPLDVTEVGAPDGTSIMVRDLFYNVPVRRKFLKTPQTEAGAVTELLEHLCLSHPEISFHYRVNGQEKLHTTGNGNIKELIYRIYGREMSSSVIPIAKSSGEDGEERLCVNGFLGRPEFSRSSRNHEIFFVNGRILKSDVLSKGLEEGYRTDLMQHRFPFAILYLKTAAEDIDVNVHPSKMEVRFSDPKRIFDFLNESVHETLHHVELIPRATMNTQAEENRLRAEEEKERAAANKAEGHAEPFERAPAAPVAQEVPAAATASPAAASAVQKVSAAETPAPDSSSPNGAAPAAAEDLLASAAQTSAPSGASTAAKTAAETAAPAAAASPAAAPAVHESPVVYKEDDFTFIDKTASGVKTEQLSFIEEASLPDPKKAKALQEEKEKAVLAGDLEAMFRKSVQEDYAEDLYGNRSYHILQSSNLPEYTIVGQIFDTYWILSFKDKMLMIDQHAAHEKVNFERLMRRLAREQAEPAPSQMLAPPIILNLTGKEEGAYLQYQDYFRRMGYDIEPFGQNSYALRGVPMELYANEPDALLLEILDEILDSRMSGTPAAILYKIASMSCKAAVKGNMHQSYEEAKALIDELLSLENPYHCPHGRPTMIVLSRQEIERKFKRIV